MPMEEDILVKLGKLIQKKTKAKGFKSNVEFGNVCNLAESTIRRILLGKQNVSIKVLEKICDVLDIKLSELFKELEE
jgi:transcriptional regulator with XRE-family HTH domain